MLQRIGRSLQYVQPVSPVTPLVRRVLQAFFGAAALSPESVEDFRIVIALPSLSE
jgi:hypothetical protein